jgi:cytochrome bd-type quinol oxidase subunit 2
LGFWASFGLAIVLFIFGVVVGIFILGMYPFMVKDYLEKKEISLKEAFFFSCHKFGSLLGVSLLVGLIIVLIRMVWFSFFGISFRRLE